MADWQRTNRSKSIRRAVIHESELVKSKNHELTANAMESHDGHETSDYFGGIATLGASHLMLLCLEAAAQSDIWRRQRRTLEKLPEPLASMFFQRLLQRRQITPPLLELFQGCVGEVCLSGNLSADATWLAYLGGFSFLRVLSLDGCTAVTSASLWHLAGLEHLEALHLNRCAKVGDPAIRHLTSLQSLADLQLSETAVKSAGAAHLANLPSLTRLHLGGLPVDDATLHALQGLVNLRHLDLWGTAVTNEGARSLPSFPALASLNLAWTAVTSVPPLPSLTSLDLSVCSIESLFGGWSTTEAPLTELTLKGARLPDTWHGLEGSWSRGLRHLDLGGTDLHDLACLRGMTGLVDLDLEGTRVGDEAMKVVAQVGHALTRLHLGRTMVGSEGLGHLGGHLPYLTWLSLEGTAMDDLSLGLLSLMPQLQSLSLKDTPVTGVNKADPHIPGLASLASLPLLRSLDLRGTQLEDASCAQLAPVTSLQSLRLSGSFLSDRCLRYLGALAELEVLQLSDALLTDSGLKHTAFSPRLRLLDLTGCWLLSPAALATFHSRHPWLRIHHESLAGGTVGPHVGRIGTRPSTPGGRRSYDGERLQDQKADTHAGATVFQTDEFRGMECEQRAAGDLGSWQAMPQGGSKRTGGSMGAQTGGKRSPAPKGTAVSRESPQARRERLRKLDERRRYTREELLNQRSLGGSCRAVVDRLESAGIFREAAWRG